MEQKLKPVTIRGAELQRVMGYAEALMARDSTLYAGKALVLAWRALEGRPQPNLLEHMSSRPSDEEAEVCVSLPDAFYELYTQRGALLIFVTPPISGSAR